MKKILRTISMVLILILLSGNSFAEAKKKELERDRKISIHRNYNGRDLDRPRDKGLNKRFESYDGDWVLLCSDTKNMVRFQSFDQLIDYSSIENRTIDLVERISKDINSIKASYRDNIVIYSKDWGGKDRIISLDMDEDSIGY